MNDEKKKQVKNSLDYAKKELDELKSKNPDGTYESLEKMIQKLSDVVEDKNEEETSWIILLKLIFIFILSYIFCLIGVTAIFGFMHFLMEPVPPIYFVKIVPILTLILFLGLRIGNVISNRSVQHPFFSLFLFEIILIAGLAIVDTTWLHLCSSFDKSLVLAFVHVVCATCIDIGITQRIVLYL